VRRLPALAVATLIALGVSLPVSRADTEIYVGYKPSALEKGRLVVDVETESGTYEVSPVGTFAVTGLRLIVKTDDPLGFSQATFDALLGKEDERLPFVEIAARIDPAGKSTDFEVYSGHLHCAAVRSDKRHGAKGPGLACSTAYDEGDDGSLFLVPRFGQDGVATRFDLYLKDHSQRVGDHKGTPVGAPFVGIMLNAGLYDLDAKRYYASKTFANARPILRLAESKRPLVLSLETFIAKPD